MPTLQRREYLNQKIEKTTNVGSPFGLVASIS